MEPVDLQSLPRYDCDQSWQWNCDHSPEPVAFDVPAMDGGWTFCGRPVSSPLGVAAGPLLNGRWILYYATLGFDVLTYKTVRSAARDCYPLPNLVPVDTHAAAPNAQLCGGETHLHAMRQMRGSWAVSFGMPSSPPDHWRRDIEDTRSRLSPEKLLSVSVVGTVQPGWTLGDLARDYAQCARWAADAGADAIEVNFSCPNVSTCDGQLYQQPDDAAVVAAAVRQQIGGLPLIAKIGHVTAIEDAETLLTALQPSVTALAMTNSVAASVQDASGRLMFDGQKRGICGDATRQASIGQTRLFADIIRRRGLAMTLIGVGGASTAGHVAEYLTAGAECVHLASAIMTTPDVALRIRRDWKHVWRGAGHD